MREGGKCWCVGTPVDRLSVVIPAKLWLGLSYTCDSPPPGTYSAVRTLQCVLCSAFSAVRTLQCVLCSAFSAVRTLQCVLCSAFSAVRTLQCRMFNCTLCLIDCACVFVCIFGACFDPVSDSGACVCLGACFDPVSHPGAWAILQWARLWTISQHCCRSAGVVRVQRKHQAGHHSLGDVGATPATVSCVQRGEEIEPFFYPPPLPRPSLSPLYLFSFLKPFNVVVCWNWRIYTLWIK